MVGADPVDHASVMDYRRDPRFSVARRLTRTIEERWGGEWRRPHQRLLEILLAHIENGVLHELEAQAVARGERRMPR